MTKPAFIPIIPRKPIVTVHKSEVVGRMRTLRLAMHGRVSKYPPARTAYRRTGTLGTGWHSEGPMAAGNDLVVIIANPTKYTGSVQGLKTKPPRQRALFAGYGWESVQTAGEEEWKKHKPAIERALQGR